MESSHRPPVNDDSLKVLLAQDHVHTTGDSLEPLLRKVANMRTEGAEKLLVRCEESCL